MLILECYDVHKTKVISAISDLGVNFQIITSQKADQWLDK